MGAMEFYYDEVDHNVLILAADGGLNRDTAKQFLSEIEALIEAGLKKIVVDCDRLEYVNSSGLATLVFLHKRMRQRGGDVKVCGVRNPIAKVLEMTKIALLFDMYPDVSRARLAFRPKEA